MARRPKTDFPPCPCTARVQFAAMVIDRFCLITFTAFTIITTIAVLLSAPHIIVA